MYIVSYGMCVCICMFVGEHVCRPSLLCNPVHDKIDNNNNNNNNNWCAPQVPMCRSWLYKAAKPPLRKADHLSLAIGDMVFG